MDWNDNIVKSFSGPVDSKDAYEAEVFALLVGCYEFLRRGGYTAIVESVHFFDNSMRLREDLSSLDTCRQCEVGVGYFKTPECLVSSYLKRGKCHGRWSCKGRSLLLFYFF